MDQAVRAGIRWSFRNESKISRNPAPSSILPDGYDPRREHAETPRVQSAGQVLGEHGKALLSLVVARQPDRQQRQWLPGAVLIGDDMGADLVMQQGLHPVRP